MSEETSSDESGEDISQLREAVDSNFLNDVMFDKSKAVNTSSAHAGPQQSKPKPSLRKCNEEQELNDLRVTPEFQKFVAKRLSHIIDTNLKEVEQTVPADESRDGTSGGIKLFSESTHVLEHSHEAVQSQTPVQHRSTTRRRRKGRGGASSSSSEDAEVSLEDLAAVAVSPEWVLSQQGTKGWSVPTRGEVITIRAANTNGCGAESSDVGLLQSSLGGHEAAAIAQNGDDLVNISRKGSKVDVPESSVEDKVTADSAKTNLRKKKKRKRLKVTNDSEKEDAIGALELNTDSDSVVANSAQKKLTKKKKIKQQKLLHDSEKVSDCVLEPNADGNKLAADLDLKRLKKSEKRKRQKLKKKLASQDI